MIVCFSWCQNNCPQGKWSPRIIASWMIVPPGLLLPCNYPKDNWSLTIFTWKLPPRKIAFRMICHLHSCPSDKWSRRKLPHRKIVPRIKYTRDIFFKESEILLLWSIVVSSCFPSLWFKLVLDFEWFLYKKKLYKHSETEIAWKKRSSQEQQIATDKVYHRKAHEILFKKK